MRTNAIRSTLLAGLLALCLPAALRADDYSTIERLLDEQAIAVARLDLARISPIALAGLISAQSDLAAALFDADAAKKFAERLRSDVGPTAYVIYGVPTSDKLPALWIVPLANPSNTAAAESAFPTSERLASDWDRRVVSGLLLAGTKQLVTQAVATLESKDKPAATPTRAALGEVFAAVADAPSAFAIVPSADQRRVLGEVTPDLPQQLGGGTLRDLFKTLDWAAVGFDPAKSVRVVLKTPTDATAIETQQHAQELQASIAKMAGAAAATDRFLHDMLPLAAAIKPRTEGPLVIFELDGEQLATALAPAMAAFTGAADRQEAMNQLKQIALAMHNYHSSVKDKDGNQHFPNAASVDAAGKPLLSWRVHLLPFLDQEALYREFHLDEPWDTEHNAKLVERMPDIYRLPGSKLRVGKTNVVLPIGEQTAYAGGKGLSYRQFTDGTSNTILALEADDNHAVIWTAPDDLQVNANDPSKGLGRHYGAGTLVMIADGSVRFLPESTSAEQLKARLSPAGREVIERE